ncbi:hypothetical protein Q5H91_10010 [Sphingomonas sp. KR1UV-12]|uniref:Uncharacterized protein n=1 Tax=Sphingomonas aurea TaxID=3063994 RepID=A0ABT9EL31_9SPHN|nr:hypothetical protein [Sphingomonas sp. KR1UV-12]MDP1027547.1 hypothetical protein [Sphingomonas sp. KR1UV-12]
MRVQSPRQRHNQRVLVLAIAYAALLFPAVYLLSRHLVSGPIAYAIGVLPALPVVGFFVVLGAYLIEERDEYLRMLIVRQTLVATGVAMTAATIWGFLEGFELVSHLPAYAWPMVWIAGQGAGACANRVIERRAA